MTTTADPARLTIRPARDPGLFDVGCTTCGGTAVLEGDQPVLEQLQVFHLLHRGCGGTHAVPSLPLPRVL